jgi:hypothetical protein
MGNKIRKEQLGKLQEIMRSKPSLVSLCGIADDATEADLSNIGMDADDVVILASELPNKGALTRLDVSSNKLVGEKGTGRYLTLDAQYSGDEGEEEEIMEPDVSGIIAIANAIPNMRALTTLDISSNGLGVPDQLPDGWIYRPHFTKSQVYQHTDERMPLHERMQGHPPTGSKFRGLDALVNAIRDMAAMTSLNLSRNKLGVEGAKHIAAGIRVSKRVVAVVLVPCSYRSDLWLNCCCLLLSTGYEGYIIGEPAQERHRYLPGPDSGQHPQGALYSQVPLRQQRR